MQIIQRKDDIQNIKKKIKEAKTYKK